MKTYEYSVYDGSYENIAGIIVDSVSIPSNEVLKGELTRALSIHNPTDCLIRLEYINGEDVLGSFPLFNPITGKEDF